MITIIINGLAPIKIQNNMYSYIIETYLFTECFKEGRQAYRKR